MMLSMLRNPVARAVAVAVVLVVWLGLGSVGGMAQGRLSQVQTNDAAAFLPSSAQSTRAAEAARDFVDTQTLPALVVLAPADGSDVTDAQLQAVARFAEQVPTLPVDGGTWADHLTGPVVPVPSQDGAAILVPVPLDGEAAEQLVDDESLTDLLVTDLRTSLADDLGATPTTAGDVGLHAWVTGPAGFVSDLGTAFAGIDGLLLLVALGAVLLILVAVYRSPFLPLVVILTAVFALALAGLVVYELADAGVLVLNGQAQGILSILVVGAAVDYSLLLVARYREELRHAEHPADAMRVAWRQTLEPVAASAGTVVAGLLCLLLSDLASNRSLGPVAAIGIGAALLAALTFLPALLLVAGRRSRALFWPRAPRPVAATTAAVRTTTTGRGAWSVNVAGGSTTRPHAMRTNVSPTASWTPRITSSGNTRATRPSRPSPPRPTNTTPMTSSPAGMTSTPAPAAIGDAPKALSGCTATGTRYTTETTRYASPAGSSAAVSDTPLTTTRAIAIGTRTPRSATAPDASRHQVQAAGARAGVRTGPAPATLIGPG